MKIKVAITLTIIAILIFSASVFAVNTYSQLKTETMPEIQSETFESYATNIANSIMNQTGLEVPDEMLTYMVQSKASGDLVCLITEENKFEIVARESLEYIGEVDITMDFDFKSYDSDTLAIELCDVYIGSYQLPDILTKDFLDYINISSEDVFTNGETLYIVIGTYDVEFLGMTVSVGVENVSIENSKMLVNFYTNSDILSLG